MGFTPAEAAELCRRAGAPIPECPVKAKASKLSNVKKQIDGIKFDSSSEATAYQILKQWERAGAISDLRLQPSFTLQEFFKDSQGHPVNSIKYSADFSFREGARLRYVDVKGHVTQAFERTMKLMKDRHPDIEIEIWDKAKVKEMSRC
jgi:hypothetical protein